VAASFPERRLDGDGLAFHHGRRSAGGISDGGGADRGGWRCQAIPGCRPEATGADETVPRIKPTATANPATHVIHKSPAALAGLAYAGEKL